MKKTIIAIDPGSTHSAWICWNKEEKVIIENNYFTNEELERRVKSRPFHSDVAIEMIACYGMAVGAETFDTCRWIGRFEAAFLSQGITPRFVYRKDIKMALCQSMRAKDANIRQALIDKLGPVGTKKKPGPLYGVSKHAWAALAVAIYDEDTRHSTGGRK